MAVGFSQHARKVVDIKVVVRPKNGSYTADVIVNGDSLSTGGLLDKRAIINYIQTELRYALAYLDFLAEASSVDAEMYNLKELLLHLKLALANVLAYEAAED